MHARALRGVGGTLHDKHFERQERAVVLHQLYYGCERVRRRHEPPCAHCGGGRHCCLHTHTHTHTHTRTLACTLASARDVRTGMGAAERL